MVSAVNRVRLMNHRSVPLKQIIHYMLIKKLKKRVYRRVPGISRSIREKKKAIPGGEATFSKTPRHVLLKCKIVEID